MVDDLIPDGRLLANDLNKHNLNMFSRLGFQKKEKKNMV